MNDQSTPPKTTLVPLTAGDLKKLLADVPDHTVITLFDNEYGDQVAIEAWSVPQFQAIDDPYISPLPPGPYFYLSHMLHTAGNVNAKGAVQVFPNSESLPTQSWACIGHEPTTQWALGDLTGSTLTNIIASVERQLNGSWNWIAPLEHGNRPSRLSAMKACELALQNNSSEGNVKNKPATQSGNQTSERDGSTVAVCAECENPAAYLFPPTGKCLCDQCYRMPGEIRIGWEEIQPNKSLNR